MTVERLPAYAELFAEVANVGFLLSHSGHGQAYFGRCHFVGPSAVSSTGSGRGEAGDCALGDKCPFELCEGGEDAEDELPGCGCGVDSGALPGEDLQPDASFSEVMDCVDEVAQVSAKSVEFPDKKSVTVAETFQACRQLGAVILLPGCLVFVEVVRVDAGDDEGIVLTWNTSDGVYSTITLSGSVAFLWGVNPAVASLVAHEVGHSITSKCYELYLQFG